ncbi:MAG: phosphatase PAP2 family protein [Acidobacteriota bacterium]
MNLRPVEVGTLIYLGWLNTVLVLFSQSVSRWLLFFVLHLAVAAGVILLACIERQTRWTALGWLRRWHFLLLFIFFFEEIHHVVHLIWPGWFDHWLITLDFAVWSAHPTIWLERWVHPLLNEVMQAAYTSYFFLLPSLGLYLERRRDRGGVELVMTATAFSYYICYVIFLLFPIESPYHSLAALQQIPHLEGPFFTRLINWVEGFGRVHGGAFPSAHVAGASVVLLAAWRLARPLFWVYLPLVTCLYASTVYGRYHYFADVVAGIVVAFVGFWVADAVAGKSPVACRLSPASRESGVGGQSNRSTATELADC